MCKEEVIETLTNTILSKGEESAQLAEKLSIIKNQLIDAGIFNQKFMVQKIDKQGHHERFVSLYHWLTKYSFNSLGAQRRKESSSCR